MADDTSLSYGVVRIGDTSIGIPLDNLSEVFHSRGQQTLPIDSDQLQGGVDLRGSLVPILNMSLVGSFRQSNESAELGVVLEHQQMSLAFYVDEIVGIASVSRDMIGQIVENKPTRDAFFGSIFPFNDAFVSILDVAQVFAIPGVFAANRTEIGIGPSGEKGPPMLTFTAGGALYSVPAVDVHAAVPKQEIEETAIKSGPCLGEITYHNRRIPVVCPVTILGLGKRHARTLSEVVVLRFPDDLLLGIAVDAIRDIRTFSSTKETNVPVWQVEPNLIEKVLVDDDEQQIFVVDVGLLRSTKHVVDIASLSRVEAEAPVEPGTADGDDTARQVTKERERYLVIELHKRIAIPLLQVTCILDQPQNLTPANANRDGFQGYFSRRGETIALVDLRERLGAGQVQHEKAQVLMTGDTKKQIGFLVDHVLGIEVSQWRTTVKDDPPAGQEPLVQLGAGRTAQVLPFMDLAKLMA